MNTILAFEKSYSKKYVIFLGEKNINEFDLTDANDVYHEEIGTGTIVYDWNEKLIVCKKIENIDEEDFKNIPLEYQRKYLIQVNDFYFETDFIHYIIDAYGSGRVFDMRFDELKELKDEFYAQKEY